MRNTVSNKGKGKIKEVVAPEQGIIGIRFHWWKQPWGSAHVTPNCVQAFLENPVGLGGLKDVAPAERMRTGTLRRAGREGRKVCMPCIVVMTQQRNEA